MCNADAAIDVLRQQNCGADPSTSDAFPADRLNPLKREARGETMHVAWTRFQRRQVSMAVWTGFECVFLRQNRFSSRILLVIDYSSLFRATLRLLSERRPQVLWVQLPPLPLLWAALWHRRYVDPDMKLVADCHNATFEPRWTWLPFGAQLLGRCDLVVVHNASITQRALEYGVPKRQLFELEDVPPVFKQPEGGAPGWLEGFPRPWIVFPGSWGRDEPIAQLLATARTNPQWTFVLTGSNARAERSERDLGDTPRNVVTPQYLEVEEFDRLLHASDLVLALTLEEGVQLSACNEALGFHKAMVVSDTPLLRAMFADGVRLADCSHWETIAGAISEALACRVELENAASRLAERRRRLWLDRFAEAPAWLRPVVRGGGRSRPDRL